MSDDPWKTTKEVGVACAGCGKCDTCTVSPDGTAFKCWRGGGKVIRSQPRQSGGAAGGGTGYVGAAHRKKAVGQTRKGKARAYATLEGAVAGVERAIDGATVGGVWPYRSHGGEIVFAVARYNLPDGDKEFRPFHPTKDGWRCGDPCGLLPLYNLPEVLARPNERAYVCEGEKACDAVGEMGLLATTSAHGSGSPEKTDWSPLAGRDVAILGDNDEAGRRYAKKSATILTGMGARVRIVPLPGLPEGGDVVEFVAARPEATPDEMRAEIERLADAAPFIDPVDLIGGPVMTCLADVVPKAIEWMWRGRIPLGRITLLVGAPGVGKSYLTCDMAARVTTGTPWPDGSPCPEGSVILINAEDNSADTIRPRTDAHHADVRRIHLLSMVRRVGEDGKAQEAMFTLADVPALKAALRAHPDCRLVVIDPIGSFLGCRTDAHRDNEVRAVLAPVAKLAETYGVAVVIVAHRRKGGGGGSADEAAMGSRAFTGLARAVHHISRDPANPARRLLLPGKNNLAAEGNGLAYTIAGEPAAVVWEQEPVAMTADDAMAAEREHERQRPGPEPIKLRAAEDFLRRMLATGEVPTAKVKDGAEAAGMKWRTVQEAAESLEVIREKNSFTGGWHWRLPKPGTDDTKSANAAPPKEDNPASLRIGEKTAFSRPSAEGAGIGEPCALAEGEEIEKPRTLEPGHGATLWDESVAPSPGSSAWNEVGLPDARHEGRRSA